jgi:hypothetical protein
MLDMEIQEINHSMHLVLIIVIEMIPIRGGHFSCALHERHLDIVRNRPCCVVLMVVFDSYQGR